MNLRVPFVAAVAAAVFFAGCRGCDDGLQDVKPILAVAPTSLNFEQVKAGGSAELSVKLSAQSQASVSITGVRVQDGPIAGTSSAYELVNVPEVVPGLSDATFTVRFKPTQLQSYEATLIIESNDEERPSFSVPITAEGTHPVMAVIPECSMQRRCEGTVVVDPPSIDFGEEPFMRAVEIPATELPAVNLANEGDVELIVSRLELTGDTDAFKLEIGAGIPAGGLALQSGEGFNVPIRFKPTSEQKTDYAAQLIIEGDDPMKPQVVVTLTGKLGANLPPVLCANITRVKPPDETELRYDMKADWDPLLTVPPGGYDFRLTRDIRPRSEVRFSAHSEASDDRTCTTDPEDRRNGLTYSWTVVSTPPGAKNVVFSGANTANPVLTPQTTIATGEYEVMLTVTDAQGHASSTTLRFAVVLKQDLVVELAWNGDDGAYTGVDFDLHLVRPSSASPAEPFSGAFSFFDEGPNAKTSGDVNGFANSYYKANMGQGIDFNWGLNGTFDDPRLNLDDTGSGQLFENISLNFPENDPECATATCTYKVMVHYFKDARLHTAPPACTVGSSCKDGEQCDCIGADMRCVAETAGKGAAGAGVGRCYRAPEPVIRIFVRSNPVPAAVIPLDTLMPPDEVKVGAPCHMLYVADVVWPSKASMGVDGGMPPEPTIVVRGTDASGRIVSPELARFGVRAQGSLSCSPNTTQGSSSQDNWYAVEPL